MEQTSLLPLPLLGLSILCCLDHGRASRRQQQYCYAAGVALRGQECLLALWPSPSPTLLAGMLELVECFT